MAEPITAGLSAAKWIGSLRPGYTTKRHNRIVEREYEDRVRWVRDQSREEEAKLGTPAEAMNAFNVVLSSTHDSEQKKIHVAMPALRVQRCQRIRLTSESAATTALQSSC